MRLLYFLLLIVLPSIASAQIRFVENGTYPPIAPESIQYYLQEEQLFSDEALLAIPDSAWQSGNQTLLEKGHYNQSLWLRMPFQQKPGEDQWVVIDNPHLNFLRLWIVADGQIRYRSEETGDHHRFDSRPWNHPAFCFQIPATAHSAGAQLILAIDKRRSKLEIPISRYDTPSFLHSSENRNLQYGLLIGALLLVLLINLYLFIRLREATFGWYCLYHSFILVYFMADKGYLFQFLYPNAPGLNDLVRPALLAISIIPILSFYRNLLQLPITLPAYNRILQWIRIGFVVIFILAFSTLRADAYRYQQLWLSIFSFLSPAILLFSLLLAIEAGRKKVRWSGFAIVSMSGICPFIILHSLVQNDQLAQSNFLFRHAHYFAIIWEAAIMLLALITRFEWIQRKNNQLQADFRQEQDQILREVADWQNQEMNKVASFLHDSIGTSLGLIRMETDYMELNEANRQKVSEMIRQLGTDVRLMSHSFSMELLEKAGLRPTLENHIKQINNLHPVEIQLEWIGEDDTIGFHYQMVVYRIVQELLQNLIKHAGAKQANLQVLTEQKHVYIYMEDDGVGAADTSGGLGLQNIQNLVKLLKGQFRIQTTPGNGFQISIEFYQADYEKDQDRYIG